MKKKKNGKPQTTTRSELDPASAMSKHDAPQAPSGQGEFTIPPELQTLIDSMGLGPLIETIKQKNQQLDQVTGLVTQLHQALEKIAEQLYQKGILTIGENNQSQPTKVVVQPEQAVSPFSQPSATPQQPASTGAQIVGLIQGLAPHFVKALNEPSQPNWMTEYFQKKAAMELEVGRANIDALSMLTKVFENVMTKKAAESLGS